MKANFGITDDKKLAVIGVFFDMVDTGAGDMLLQSIYPKLDGLGGPGHNKREEKRGDSFEVQTQLVPQQYSLCESGRN